MRPIDGTIGCGMRRWLQKLGAVIIVALMHLRPVLVARNL